MILVNALYVVSAMIHIFYTLKRGFTLVELSIVLVIIALIVGGIIVGQMMISNSQIRSTLSQIDNYKSAIGAFRMKYNCLPGDCPNAVNFGLGTNTATAGHNGNGDTTVSVLKSSASVIAEFYNFWYHLYMAKLISENVDGYTLAGGSTTTDAGKLPPAKIGKGNYIGAGYLVRATVFDDTVGNSILLGGTVNSSGTACSHTCGGGLTASEAYQFDNKIDDGLPETGSVRELRNGYQAVNAALGNVARGCHHGGNLYDITGQSFGNTNDPDLDPLRKECAILFSGAF